MANAIIEKNKENDPVSPITSARWYPCWSCQCACLTVHVGGVETLLTKSLPTMIPGCVLLVNTILTSLHWKTSNVPWTLLILVSHQLTTVLVIRHYPCHRRNSSWPAKEVKKVGENAKVVRTSIAMLWTKLRNKKAKKSLKTWNWRLWKDIQSNRRCWRTHRRHDQTKRKNFWSL